MKAFPQLHRSFLTLSIGEAAARILGFAATIFVARSLGAGAYGIISVAAAVRLYLVCMVEAGIDSVGVREVAAAPAQAGRLAGSLLLARLGIAAVLALALLAGSLSALPQPDGAVVALYGLSLLPVALNTRWLHLGLQRTRSVALARLAGEATLAIVVLLGVRSTDDLILVPLAQFLGDWVAAMLLALGARRMRLEIPLRFDPVRARPPLVHAWPLAVHALLGLVIFNSDLLFLRAFGEPETAGYYAGAYALIGFLLNLGLMHYHALLPGLSAVPEGAPASDLYRTALRGAFTAGLPVALAAGILAAPILGLVFGPSFSPAVVPLQLLLLSIPLALLRQVGQAGLVARGRAPAILRATIWAMLLALALNLTLIPELGMRGAALATVATELFRAGLVLAWAARAGYPTPWQAGLGRPVVAAFGMGGVLLWLAAGSPILALLLGGLVYLVLIGLGRGPRRVEFLTP